MSDEQSNRDAAVQSLLDKDAIREVVARAVRGVDRLDAALLSSAFHPDGVDDHHGFAYTGATIGTELTQVERESMLMTSLHITTQTVEVHGDRAGVESYYLGVHRPSARGGASRLLSSGRMLDEMERRDGEWRIIRREVIPDMARLLPIEDEIDLGEQPSRRDGADPSYRVLCGPAGVETTS
jgi:hypothetical protein